MRRFFGFLVFLAVLSTVFIPAMLPGYNNGVSVHGSGAPIDPLNTVLTNYANYDMNHDGTIEINYLNPLSFESNDEPIWSYEKMMVVLVEPRLLQYIPGSTYNEYELLYRLESFKADLRAEGYRTRFIEASVYNGGIHQDGQTVLALREFFKSVKANYPGFEGAILVGSFPEAELVRRWVWKRPIDKGGLDIGGYNYLEGTPYLNIVPEIVAGRTDLVLADLDGNWRNIYRQSVSIECLVGMPKSSAGTGWPATYSTLDFERVNYKNTIFTDVFYIKDDDYSVLNSNPASFSIIFNSTLQRNPEISTADASLCNPITRPEIYISRINPRHIATNPDPNFTDKYGKKFLDANGKPQAVEANAPIDLTIGVFWKRDANLERRILIDYFDRNHTYRTGKYADLPFRTATVQYGDGLPWQTSNDILNKASSQFASSVVKSNASLVDFVNWLKNPAILKGIYAHSSPWNSEFGTNYTPVDLETACGGIAWVWQKEGDTLVYKPSYADWGGLGSQYLYRTLWESKVLQAAGPNLFLHLGCDVNTPGFADQPYTFEHYGEFQNAESCMFYLNGLALLSRAKGFYDSPSNFGTAYAASERTGFGSGWKRYFEDESNDSGLAANLTDNKRVYPWSMLGDWTLRKRYANGIGILGWNSASGITDQAIGANEAALNNWYFSTDNQVAGTGDLNADSADEVIVTSDWGIGIIEKNMVGLKSVALYANDSWLGDWRYNAVVNSGKDKILGVANFNNDGKKEILIQSSWGMGILAFNDGALTSLVTVPSGTMLPGGWRTSSTDNTIRAIADFNGDGKDEILVTSPWGYGVLELMATVSIHWFAPQTAPGSAGGTVTPTRM